MVQQGVDRENAIVQYVVPWAAHRSFHLRMVSDPNDHLLMLTLISL